MFSRYCSVSNVGGEGYRVTKRGKTRHCINLREAKTYGRGNAKSKYTLFIIGVDTDTHKVSLVGMRAFKNVEDGGQTNATLLFTTEDKRNVEWR